MMSDRNQSVKMVFSVELLNYKAPRGLHYSAGGFYKVSRGLDYNMVEAAEQEKAWVFELHFESLLADTS